MDRNHKVRSTQDDKEIKPEEQKPFVSSTKEMSEYSGPPIEVEGSTEYLRVILPSSEHPSYTQVFAFTSRVEFPFRIDPIAIGGGSGMNPKYWTFLPSIRKI